MPGIRPLDLSGHCLMRWCPPPGHEHGSNFTEGLSHSAEMGAAFFLLQLRVRFR